MKKILATLIACAGILMLAAHWSGAQWVKSNLPYSRGLTVYALAASGSDIFAGTAVSGIFHSMDSGKTWDEVSLGPGSLYASAIAISGGDVFVGTGNGIFRSADNGKSWIAADSGYPAIANVGAFAFLGNNIFACDARNGNGIFRSAIHSDILNCA